MRKLELNMNLNSALIKTMDSSEVFWYESFLLKNRLSSKAICLLASYFICSLQQESEAEMKQISMTIKSTICQTVQGEKQL